MFKSLATAAVIVLATATASLASTGWSTGDVNMRQGPGTGYYTVGAIPRCASFTVYAEDRGWYQVNWRGVVGWVSGRYVAYNDNHCHYQAPVQRAPLPAAISGSVLGWWLRRRLLIGQDRFE